MGRSQPNIMIDVQAPVTHAAIVATMEREMGHPPRLFRTPDVCDRFQASEEARRPSLVDRWVSQERTGRDTSTPTTGLIRKAGPRMRSTTDYVHEGRDQTARPSTGAQFPDETMDAPRDMEGSFEEIER